MQAVPSRLMLLAAAMLAFAGGAVAHDATGASRESVVVDFSRPIPNVPGKSLVAVEVTYPPGAASPAHVHAASAFIYAHVVSGAIESRVDDGPVRVYRAGDSFHEEPGSRHSVSRNASQSEPAKLLAVFVVDTGDTDLTTPTE